MDPKKLNMKNDFTKLFDDLKSDTSNKFNNINHLQY